MIKKLKDCNNNWVETHVPSSFTSLYIFVSMVTHKLYWHIPLDS